MRSISRRVENIEKKVFSGKQKPQRKVRLIDAFTEEEFYAYYLEVIEHYNRQPESFDENDIEQLKKKSRPD